MKTEWIKILIDLRISFNIIDDITYSTKANNVVYSFAQPFQKKYYWSFGKTFILIPVLTLYCNESNESKLIFVDINDM